MAQASRELAPSDRILRHINILVFIPGLAFLIATGLTSGTAIWPFVGIAPLALSAIVGFLILLLRPRSHAMVTLTDLGLACFHLAIAIWGWAVGRGAEIGGLASAALLAEFFVHAFFVLREVYRRVQIPTLSAFGRSGCKQCPHCLSEARAKKSTVQPVGSKESYHRVPGRDDGYDEDLDGGPSYSDARPSTDDETARLV